MVKWPIVLGYPALFWYIVPGVSQWAAKALGVLGDESAVEPLVLALKDKNSEVRESAAEALGKIGGDRGAKEAGLPHLCPPEL